MAASTRKSVFLFGIKRGILVSLVASVSVYGLGIILGMLESAGGFLLNIAPRDILGPMYFLIVVGYALVRGNKEPLNSIKGLLGYWIGGVLLWLPVLLVLIALKVL